MNVHLQIHVNTTVPTCWALLNVHARWAINCPTISAIAQILMNVQKKRTTVRIFAQTQLDLLSARASQDTDFKWAATYNV
jgi:hypothetical protein